jgi:hypothetical protein
MPIAAPVTSAQGPYRFTKVEASFMALIVLEFYWRVLILGRAGIFTLARVFNANAANGKWREYF